MTKQWLKDGMLSGAPDAEKAAEDAITQLMDYGGTSGHNHHFLLDNCKAIGLKIEELEADQKLQEAVLSVHHSFMATFSRQNAIKIVENSAGATWAVGS